MNKNLAIGQFAMLGPTSLNLKLKVNHLKPNFHSEYSSINMVVKTIVWQLDRNKIILNFREATFPIIQ